MADIIRNVKFGHQHLGYAKSHKPVRKGDRLTMLGILALSLAVAVGVIIGTIISQALVSL